MKSDTPRLRAYDDYEAVPAQGETIEKPPHDPHHPFRRTKGEKARNRKNNWSRK